MIRILTWSMLLICFAATGQNKRPEYGGKLKPEQANMDIRHYTIDLSLDIPRKALAGSASIKCNLLKPATVLLFDLMDSFHVEKVTVNAKQAAFTHDSHLLRITTDQPWLAGPAEVTVQYAGHPMIALRPPWDDGFTFSEDSTGHPWVAVTAEGTGGKIYFPAKDHPSDEPDEGVDLIITVPEGLVVAGPGLLVDVRTKKGKSRYHWKTNYPINNYSIVFNVGDYVVVKRNYTTVDGHQVPMEFYVLKEHAGFAPHQLELLEKFARVKEKYFGEYPWVREKIGIVETPHLGMEHQTMNAYGNRFRYTRVGGQDYDGLMNHEFGHEWWGNKVTAGDWADYWIHEGIGTFGDDLYIRDMEGEEAYEKIFQRSVYRIRNDKPVVMGKDITEDEAYHPDIYPKGAFFMHTLRYVLGDSVFFPALKRVATDPDHTYTHPTSTAAVERVFENASGKDLSELFHLYLYTTEKLEVSVRPRDASHYLVRLLNMNMPLPLDITGSGGTSRQMVDEKGVLVTSETMPQIDTRDFYLKKVIYDL